MLIRDFGYILIIMSEKKLKELINKVLQKNEAEANLVAAKVMRITMYIFSLVYALNVAGIFIIDPVSMNITFFTSAILLFAPTFLNKVVSTGNRWLKYIYVIFSALFIFLAATVMTYHAIIAYIFPVLIAAIYFDKTLTLTATLVTCILTSFSQFIGFSINKIPDANFHTLYEMVIFSILPKLMCLIAISNIIILLSKRTDRLLKEQIKNTHEIATLNNEMIIGFVTLVENRDINTGGHIVRTSRYVEILAKEMKRQGLYPDELTDDFIENLKTAAPMHDIGKICIPDAILQKPGKLTPEEFEIMKSHSTKGGDILLTTFSHIGSKEFRKMALEITYHHHEKWNGKGYPDGLSGTDIPLSARIMSIADVFDALSEDRCYRKAMPLDESFAIIKNGSGTDFEKDIVDIFMSLRPEIEKIHNNQI